MTNTFSSKLSIDALMMALMKCFHLKPNNQKCSGSYDHLSWAYNENDPEDFALNNNQEHKSGHLLQELFHENNCKHMNQLYCDMFPFFNFFNHIQSSLD